MAISDRIQSIEQHIKESYQELEGIGIDTTEVDKNLENIPKLIDGYWETLPKVTGEGISITLDNTKEGKMKINLKGNTSQETAILPSEYTQVDYIQSSGTQYIDTGYTFTSTKEKIDFKYSPLVIENARVCGSYISAHRGMIIQPRQQDMAEVGGLSITPSFSISANTDYKVVLEANEGNYSFVFGDNSQTGTYTYTPITNRSHYIFAVNFTGTATKATMKLYYYKMYDNDVLVRDYVPCYRNSDNEVGLYDLVNNVFYTNAGTGAFTKGSNTSIPNPDYPQDIHVVSGDNSIEVVGKNLLDIDTINFKPNNYTITKTNDNYKYTVSSSGTWWQAPNYKILNILPNTQYTYSFNVSNISITSGKNSRILIDQIDSNEEVISISGSNHFIDVNSTGKYSKTFTTTANTRGFIIRVYVEYSVSTANTYVTLSNFMVEKGSSASTYEAYTGASYPVSLGVENLLDISNQPVSLSYSGNYKMQTLASNLNLNLSSGNYTISLDIKSANGNRINKILFYDSNNTDYTWTLYKIIPTSYQNNKYTFTFENDITITRIDVQNAEGGDTYTFNNIQLEKGSKANSYTPYGTTPIELCKIGDYQDSIKKSTGKNLFDKDNVRVGYRFGSDGEYYADTGYNATEYIRVQPNTLYSVSWAILWDEVVCTYDINKNFVRRIQSGTNFTTSASEYYIRADVSDAHLSTAQIEKGTTALDYEPYGKVWYLKKEIGKIVLNGTQNITLASSGTRRFNATYTTLGISNVKEGTSAEDTTLHYRMNDHFIYSAGQNTWGRYYLYNNWLVMLDSGSVIASASDLSTWLSNNNTTIYYVLATPTYTEITDSTLISQLEALNGAKSYTTQTNINQENNDNASILNASALSE